MNYYKIIKDNKFIGVTTSDNLRRYQEKHNVILLSDQQKAQYIQFNDKLYRDKWFAPIDKNTIEYEKATVSVIQKSEYDKLYDAVKAGDIVEVTEKPKADTTTTTPKQNTTVERTAEVSPVDRIEILEKQQKELEAKIDELLNEKEG